MRTLLAPLLLLAACGGDDTPAAPPTRPAAPAGGGAAAAAKKKTDKNTLQPRRHVEDSVECPIPDKPTGPECKIDAPTTCDTGTYCIPTPAGFHCEPCPERDAIRHEFRDRDFAADQVRDPFESFVVNQGGLRKPTTPIALDSACKREDQFVASNYSFQELKLVGIVSQGTQRKVLMIGPDRYGYIIRRADCVGKEKAIVKDIGTGYVTFVTQADPTKGRPPAEYSQQLYTSPVTVTSQPTLDTAPTAPVQPPTTAPVVAPPK